LPAKSAGIVFESGNRLLRPFMFSHVMGSGFYEG